MRTIIVTIIATLSLHQAMAQDRTLPSLNQQRNRTTATGMIVLGSWAVGNLVVGAIGRANTSGTTKYFHEMNMLWNTVNLTLAGFGLYGALHANADLSLAASLREQHKLEKLFLVNGALDLAYMAGGLYLQERGNRPGKNSLRWKGYGKSILLQGAFLLLFDGAMYGIVHHKGKGLYKLMEKVQLTAGVQQVGVTVRL
jgi:hypothetical protein